MYFVCFPLRSSGVPLLTEESLATLDDGMWLDDIVMDFVLR